MKLLLDTNVFIWASREPHLLSTKARSEISDPLNERFVSIGSIWEMQIKHALGKLGLSKRIAELGQAWMQPLAAQLLSIQLAHIDRLYDLPTAHRDPFDRLLIAQAIAEGMKVVSADVAFRSYAVEIVW